MAAPLKAELPPDCTLSAGYIIRLTALDPTTGATVAGVNLTDISIFVTDVFSAPGSEIDSAFPLLVPTDTGE